jgi:hypothetical protein
MSVGEIRLITSHQSKPDDIYNPVDNERKLSTIRGVIITEPYVQKYQDWKFGRFKPSDPKSGFYLKMKEI